VRPWIAEREHECVRAKRERRIEDPGPIDHVMRPTPHGFAVAACTMASSRASHARSP
jgi:hypothetical protein